jgi:hypothetical protein
MPPFLCNHQNLAAIPLTIKTSRRAAGAWRTPPAQSVGWRPEFTFFVRKDNKFIPEMVAIMHAMGVICHLFESMENERLSSVRCEFRIRQLSWQASQGLLN